MWRLRSSGLGIQKLLSDTCVVDIAMSECSSTVKDAIWFIWYLRIIPMLGHKFPNPGLVLHIFHVPVGVRLVHIMLFTFRASLSSTRIYLSPVLKIVPLSLKSHSMLSSSAYFLASLDKDLWNDFVLFSAGMTSRVLYAGLLSCWYGWMLLTWCSCTRFSIRLIPSLLVLAVRTAMRLIHACVFHFSHW